MSDFLYLFNSQFTSCIAFYRGWCYWSVGHRCETHPRMVDLDHDHCSILMKHQLWLFSPGIVHRTIFPAESLDNLPSGCTHAASTIINQYRPWPWPYNDLYAVGLQPIISCPTKCHKGHNYPVPDIFPFMVMVEHTIFKSNASNLLPPILYFIMDILIATIVYTKGQSV